MKNKSYQSYQFAEKLIEEFKDKGFVESFSNHHFLDILRERYAQYFKVFDAGHKISAGRLTRRGVYEIFGKRMIYYYDRRREDEFVDFLVDKFYTNNPDASQDIQSSFTRVLHIHGLCWAGCVFHNNASNVRKFKNKKRNDKIYERYEK